MLEFLQVTVDKFTFKVATDRLYTPEGEWIRPPSSCESNRVRVGVTDFFQQHSGDVAFVNLKPEGTTVRLGDEFAEVETMKVNVELAAPVSGTIVRLNEALVLKPELLNEDPYGDSWLAEIEASHWESDRAALLDAPAYLAVMKAEAEEEVKS